MDFDTFFIPKETKQNLEVAIGINSSHAHLSEKDCVIAYNCNILKSKRKLLQPGAFASYSTLRHKSYINKAKNHYIWTSYTIVGPLRNYSQLELTAHDASILKRNFPMRMSGDLEGCPLLTVWGSTDELIEIPAFIALNHIHLDHKHSRENGRDILKKVRIFINQRWYELIIDAKYQENARPEIHLNADYAQMLNIKKDEMYQCELID